jgi:hypothetical protein
VGNTLRRLLIALTKSHAQKNQQKHAVKSRSQSFPFSVKKYLSYIPQKENETLKPEILAKMPLLEKWLERGKG